MSGRIYIHTWGNIFIILSTRKLSGRIYIHTWTNIFIIFRRKFSWRIYIDLTAQIYLLLYARVRCPGASCRNWTFRKAQNIWFLVLKCIWPKRETTVLCLNIGIDYMSSASISWTLAKITHGRPRKETPWLCFKWRLWNGSNIWFSVLKDTCPKREIRFLCLHIGIGYISSVSWTLAKVIQGCVPKNNRNGPVASGHCGRFRTYCF